MIGTLELKLDIDKEMKGLADIVLCEQEESTVRYVAEIIFTLYVIYYVVVIGNLSRNQNDTVDV